MKLFVFLLINLYAIQLVPAQQHQGSLYSLEGTSIKGVKHVDVSGPSAPGRNYGWPANTVSIHRWGSEMLLGFRNYRYVWKGYWQHTKNGNAADTCDNHNTLVRSLDNGLTWNLEEPDGYSNIDKANPEIRDCSEISGEGIPWTHPDLVFEIYWMEHSTDETRHYFHWSTDRGKTWTSGRYKLPALAGLTHVEPRTDYLVFDAKSALVMVSGELKPTAGNDWEGAAIVAYRTIDGGKTWSASMVDLKQKAKWKGMTSTIKANNGEILTSIRNHRIVNYPHPGKIQSISDIYSSPDNGVSWKYRSTPWILEEDVFGNPSTLLKLKSGKLISIMGNRRSSAQSHSLYASSKIQCRVSADNGKTWGPVYTINDGCGTWDIGYQRATLLDDGTVFTAYYYADRVNFEGNFNGEEENHRVPRRIVGSIFNAENLSAEPMPINPYRKLEATACDYSNAHFRNDFCISEFNTGKYFLFQNLRFNNGVGAIKIGYAAAKGGVIELRSHGISGPVVARFTVAPAAGEGLVEAEIINAGAFAGMQTICLISKANEVADIDYIEFEQK